MRRRVTGRGSREIRPPVCELVVVGQEVARRARELDATYLTAHLGGDHGELVFTAHGKVVSVTGRGFEVELSALPEWHRRDSDAQ